MTVKHESLHKTKWVELMQRTSEEHGTYIYIREPWLLNGKAVSVLPYRRDESGYVQFLLRGEMADSPVFGTVKGGMDKEGETPRQCAVRELLEEVGYTADEVNLIALGMARTSKLNTTKMYLFAVDVTNLPYEEPKGDGTANEANAYCQWVSEADAIGYEDPVIHTTMLRLYNWTNQQEGE
ncbi:NUDIX hydrolase [Paenibacillus agilis]|uniref:NUDIX hydrolase n=1 Tax=Paenibacillus agilis TaxID=3020863 RepID=A0A559IEQ8_9BACL|nr:NUDIX hydrolase [Paenibacillus agilis]TVX86000.1 NUDIX hydrolase [Paenibacillus agilis]